MNRQKIEQQTRDGVIVMGWSIEPIEQLTCILPAKLTLQRVDDVRPQLRAMPYSSLLAAVRGEFAAANQMQEDRTIINTANIFAVYAVLHNPAFGAEVRALLAEVRRKPPQPRPVDDLQAGALRVRRQHRPRQHGDGHDR